MHARCEACCSHMDDGFRTGQDTASRLVTGKPNYVWKYPPRRLLHSWIWQTTSNVWCAASLPDENPRVLILALPPILQQAEVTSSHQKLNKLRISKCHCCINVQIPFLKLQSGLYFRCFTIAPRPPWAKLRRFLSNTHPPRPSPPTKLLIQASRNNERLNSLWHHLQGTFQQVCGRRVTDLISINCNNVMKKWVLLGIMNKVNYTQYKTLDENVVDPQHTRSSIFWMCGCVVWWKETAAYIFRIFWSNQKREVADNCVLERDTVFSGSHRRFRRNFAFLKARLLSTLEMEEVRLLELTLCSFEVVFWLHLQGGHLPWWRILLYWVHRNPWWGYWLANAQ